MPVTLNCTCGKILRVPDEHAGKRVKCPACSAVISSAPPEPAFEVVEDEPRQLAPTRPAARPRADEEDDVRPAPKAGTITGEPRKPSFRKRADDDEDEPKPRKKKKKRKSRRGGSGFWNGPDSGKRISYVVGGVIFIIVGIVLAAMNTSPREGRRPYSLLIFGIALAVGGLISVYQGVTGNLPDDDE